MGCLDETTISALDGAVKQTFESMAFIELARHDGEPDPEPAEDWLWTAIDLLEPMKGTVCLACSEALANQIATSMFGPMEPEQLEQVRTDAHAEMANTIAGKFLGLAAPVDEAISVGLPDKGTGWPPDQAYDAHVAYRLDDGQHIWLLCAIDA